MGLNNVLEGISALTILLIYIISRITTKNRDYKAKILETSCIVTLITVLTGYACMFCIQYMLNEYSIILCYILLCISLLGESLIPFIFTIYIFSHLYREKETLHKKYLLISIPIIIELILLITYPFNHMFLSISNEGDISGIAVFYNYTVKGIFILISLYLLIKHWKVLNRSFRAGVLIYPLVTISTIIIHFIFTDISLTVFGTTIVILLLILITQQRQIQTDDLTRLLSRQVFFEHIALLENDRQNYKIFIISLKNFNIVNNNYGTYIGDRLLTDIGSFLENKMEGFQVYRYSGDEYAVLLKNKHLSSSDLIISNIISRFDEKWKVEEFNHRLSAYFGVLTSKSLQINRIPIVTFTDYFIKYVKENYEDKLIICNDDIVQKVGRKEDVHSSIYRAIANKSFLVYLQPIFDLQKKCFISAEALIRLEDEHLGMIYPNEFIPIAEERNLISIVDLIMFEKVCEILRDLEEQNIEIKGISVNFSVDIFMENDLVERLKALIIQYKVPPGRIRIEITETILAKSYVHVRLIIEELKKIGILFYLDDFGIGYSNLVSVIKLPFDYIKLDKALTDELESSKMVRDLVKSLCQIFSSRGFDIICEGVETKKQLELLEKCNVRYIQGYFYARPLPAEETIHLFKNQKIQPSQ